MTQVTSIWKLPNVYFQNLLLINNTPDNTLQPQMHICPLPCAPFEQKWLSQHIFKKQIPNWRKLPQFESCQMYIFQISSSSTIHQTTTFNLKRIFVHSHAHPLSKNGWISIFLKKRFQIDASDLNLKVAKCIFSKSTPRQQYTRQYPSTSNANSIWELPNVYFPNFYSHHSLWAKISWVSIFLKKRFQIDASDLNLKVAKCIFSKSTPHQQYTRQQPSTSNAYLSTPIHTLWAKMAESAYF